jgi:RNA polymerase sigma factor (sigma-70 family)
VQPLYFNSVIISTNNRKYTLSYVDPHKEVVESCLAGNRQAQFELYRLYSKAMYNVCLRMLKNSTDAEDVLQNSFMDAFGRLHTFGFQSTFGAWMKRIVINNCINFLQRRKFSFDEYDANTHGKDAIQYEEDVTYEALNVERIQKAMAQLPDGYRVVFSLYMFEGYDHEEISEILKISESTSKSQFHRAKIKLKELLK